MLHHTNVDRLVALWQAIHYNNSMFTITGTSTGQFGTAPGTAITADSPLKPFFDKDNNFHTSNSVRDISALGYTYPELADAWTMSAEELASSARAQVNALYGQADLVAKQRARRRGRGRSALSASQLKYYTAEMQVERSELPVPCSVDLVVLGRIIASMSLLAMPTAGMAFASVPLQEVIPRFNLKDTTVGDVVPFLQENIRVRIRTVRGCCGGWLESGTSPFLSIS